MAWQSAEASNALNTTPATKHTPQAKRDRQRMRPTCLNALNNP
jgi:hypothetical protein